MIRLVRLRESCGHGFQTLVAAVFHVHLILLPPCVRNTTVLEYPYILLANYATRPFPADRTFALLWTCWTHLSTSHGFSSVRYMLVT